MIKNQTRYDRNTTKSPNFQFAKKQLATVQKKRGITPGVIRPMPKKQDALMNLLDKQKPFSTVATENGKNTIHPKNEKQGNTITFNIILN